MPCSDADVIQRNPAFQATSIGGHSRYNDLCNVLPASQCTTLSLQLSIIYGAYPRCSRLAVQRDSAYVVSYKMSRTPSKLPTAIQMIVPVVTESTEAPLSLPLGLGAGELL
jgi:hypothetical protein